MFDIRTYIQLIENAKKEFAFYYLFLSFLVFNSLIYAKHIIYLCII
jgi:hypothetical protein